MNYSIVSNSCVSIRIYELYNPGTHYSFINYNNPFIASWFPDDESYIKLCENYEHYVSLTPVLDKPPINLKWERDTGSKKHIDSAFKKNYIVMFLDDVEIHWIHDTNPDQLLKKYKGRLQLSKDFEHIFLWSDAELFNIYTESERLSYFNRFNNLNKKTIFLTKNKNEEFSNDNTIVKYVPQWEGKTQYEKNEKFLNNWYTHPFLAKYFVSEIKKFEK